VALVPQELLVPGALFVVYLFIVWMSARIFVGEWISVPLAMLTVFLAGSLQVVILFGLQTAGLPSAPAWFQGGVLELACWFVSVKAMIRTSFYRALLISLVVQAVAWVFRAAGLDWSIGPVMLGVGKLIRSLL
jgi:hypothetical protein